MKKLILAFSAIIVAGIMFGYGLYLLLSSHIETQAVPCFPQTEKAEDHRVGCSIWEICPEGDEECIQSCISESRHPTR